ncbi:MAG: putative quinol monooxygenase [Alphaproteobacteria bacterium]|jgi:quinol monooxygenase YgiN
MIDLIVTLQVKPGMEAKVEDLMRQLEQETAENDPGCLRYQWYSAHEQPCLYYLLERWTNQESLEAHFQAAHIKRILPQLADCAVAKVTTTKLTRLE